MNNFVLVLAFGIDEAISEARFLLLRQLAVSRERDTNYEFVIYTDRPEDFAMFEHTNVRLRLIHCAKARFEAWRGAIDFIFRIKIEFLRDFCSQNEGNVLYLDADVYPRCDLAPLFAAIGRGNFFMRSPMGAIDECPWFDDFRRFFARTTVPVGGVERRIRQDAQMWDAGVIGFSTAQRGILDRVLEMTEVMYPALKAHATEQFAFSYVLSQSGRLSASEEYVYHYFDLAQRGFADVIAQLIARFENRPLAELVAATEHILPERLEPAQPKRFGRMLHHRVYMRFPALWHAANSFRRARNRQASTVTRFQHLVDSL